MLKRLFIAGFILFSSVSGVFAANLDKSEIIGRWAEKISERVVADIIPTKHNGEYNIFITWREDGLAQKDVYRFLAKDDGFGNLKYKDGIHLYRYYDKNKTFSETVDYKNGYGSFKVQGNELIWFDGKDKTESSFIKANNSLVKDTILENKYFSITLPEELKGSYETKIKKTSIALYHKESKKAGFGGFAFALNIYEKPSQHAMFVGSRKIGELVDKKGKLYDMVVSFPTDVQYDYTKGEAPAAYKILYDNAENMNLVGIKGSKYYKDQGMKGQDLYKEVLDKHIKAIREKWDSTKLEKENMSYMYNVLSKGGNNVLDKIGYAYYDSNGDGIEELFIGEISKGNLKGVSYDIYTMIDRKPFHVVSGGTRDRYFACDSSFICREYLSGALESGMLVYALVENSTELFPQVGFKYDGYENRKNPWFISYSFGSKEGKKDEWENVSKDKFLDRRKVFERYERFNYTPLSRLK